MSADTTTDPVTSAVAAPHIRRAEELAASTARALAGVPALRFRGHVLHDGRRPGAALAPHLRVDAGRDDARCLRGAVDGVALQLLHSDAGAHEARRPTDPVARFVFDQLEQFRTESLVSAGHPGVRGNLRHRFRHWAVGAHDGGLTGTASGLLLHTLGEVARARITDDPPPCETERVTEAPRYALAPLIGHELMALRRNRSDQERFAEHALALAGKVADLVGGAPGRVRVAGSRGERALAALLGGEQSGEASPHAVADAAAGGPGRPGGYRVFTSEFDQECRAGELLRRELLREHRARLDELVARACPARHRLATMLEAELTVPSPDGWDHGRDAGRVDGRRLPALFTTPGERHVFRDERVAPAADAHVTLLLDCSGSMKVHADYVAVLADVLARALEQIEVPCAVLGFSTRSWHGGRARRAWRRAGCPEDPGRVAERLHLLLADESRSWRHSRLDLAALLTPVLFREGLDGEALAWAVGRTAGTAYRRRIVLVCSDGGPAESATDAANAEGLLDGHLVSSVEAAARGEVEVIGLGFGRDLSAFYPRSTVLDPSLPPTTATFREVVGLLGRPAR